MNLDKELETAQELARAAGAILLEQWDKPLEASRKEDGSLVTLVDSQVARFLDGELARRFPLYGILDEEHAGSHTRERHRRCWVVDPLDSTSSYARHEDTFSVLIGLLEDYRPVLGVAYRPVIAEMAYAVQGEGAYLTADGGDRRLAVSLGRDLTILSSMDRNTQALDTLLAGLDVALHKKMPGSFKTIEVAKGEATAFLSLHPGRLNIWDLCAPEIILTEAGGRMTGRAGNPIAYARGLVDEDGIVATNGQVHDYLIRAVRGQS